MAKQLDDEERELSGSGIRARFVTEQFIYYQQDSSAAAPWSIRISLATTAIGGRLVSDDRDLTGVMLWPASHLLCQHLVQGDIVGETSSHTEQKQHDSSSPATDHQTRSVLEIGCGCGLVSLVGILKSSTSNVTLWMVTDIDADALELCRQNFAMHGVSVDSDQGRAKIRTLAWGDRSQMDQIFHELVPYSAGSDCGSAGFDVILGADIVYPDTSDETLAALFRTVDTLLAQAGTFYLAFATRDGAKTPSRFLQAASDAGFAVERLPALVPDIARQLPPLLDSKLLVLRRDANAREHNIGVLGSMSCPIFPGLWDAVIRLENPSSEEEWEPPFAGSDNED